MFRKARTPDPWAIARMGADLEMPMARWDIIVRLQRQGEYLGARALERGDVAGLLILLMMREKGMRAPISHN